MAVATVELSTCTRASPYQPAIATAANGSFAIAPRPERDRPREPRCDSSSPLTRFWIE